MLILGHPLLMVQRLSWISKQITCKECTQRVKIDLRNYVYCQHAPAYKYRRNFYSFSGLAYQEFIANLDFKTLKTGQADLRMAGLALFLIFGLLLTTTFCFLQLFVVFKVSILFLLLTVITLGHSA
jgi:hypothetical protein